MVTAQTVKNKRERQRTLTDSIAGVIGPLGAVVSHWQVCDCEP